MIAPDIQRSPSNATHAEGALMALDRREGLYFGVDAGVPGLHPLQATLMERAAVRLRLWGDGIACEALSAFGRSLLAQPQMAAWLAGSGRGLGRSALELARGFLACFAPSPDVLLLGALPFEAHRLAEGTSDAGALGVLYLPEQMLRRDAAGRWEQVTLTLPNRSGGDVEAHAVAPSEVAGGPPTDDLSTADYVAMVRRAVDMLRERPLVSLTLSQSYRRKVALSPSQAFARLREANPAPASFFLNDGSGLHLLGASPDLQLVVRGRAIETLPVCGTVARRPGAQGEAESLRELLNEHVDAAALAVCSDALRNDLAPLCEPGSLRLVNRRRPMSLATVVHAVDHIAGQLRAGVDAWDAIAATAAPVMLTGAPRHLALDAIAQLEPSPRGWYGGMVVQVASDGDALVGTILRAAAVRGGIAEVRTGGDLLAESSPEREEAESRLKTRSLWRAFGLDDAGSAGVPAASSSGTTAKRAVRLTAHDDPFAAALADLLQARGHLIDERADLVVLAGDDAIRAAPLRRIVAIGDSAYRVLAASGAHVEPCAAEQGHALDCSLTPDAPLRADGLFTVGRYARHRLLSQDVAGWTVWARDVAGAPVLLLREGVACLLYRPDSLLSDATALALFEAALDAVASG